MSVMCGIKIISPFQGLVVMVSYYRSAARNVNIFSPFRAVAPTGRYILTMGIAHQKEPASIEKP